MTSARDHDIWDMYLCGFTNRQIAQVYDIAPETARQAVNRAFRRIDKTGFDKEQVRAVASQSWEED